MDQIAWKEGIVLNTRSLFKEAGKSQNQFCPEWHRYALAQES